MKQVAAARHTTCDDAEMGLWIVLALVLFLWFVMRADSRDRVNLPTRSWNIWFGPKPREGESRARYSLRRALAATIAAIVLALPLFIVSPPPDEGTSFSGNESIVDLLVFMICMPLSAMAVVTLLMALLNALVSVVFQRRHAFDGATGEFLRR